MTRKQRHQGASNETHNLATPRGRAAFEALLADDDDGADAPAATQQRRRPPPPGPKKRDKETFFKLKDDGTGPSSSTRAGTSSTVPTASALQLLAAMFAGACDDAVIADVLAATGGDYEATVDALLAMTGGAGASSINGESTQHEHDSACLVFHAGCSCNPAPSSFPLSSMLTACASLMLVVH